MPREAVPHTPLISNVNDENNNNNYDEKRKLKHTSLTKEKISNNEEEKEPKKSKKTQFILAISGARIFNNYELFKKLVKQYLKEHHNSKLPDKIISGGADGTDTMAKQIAKHYNIDFKDYVPEYDKFPETQKKTAPLERNKDIVNAATHVIAFPKGDSPGTRHAISYAKKNNKPIIVYEVGEA